jgi:cell division protein ZipA
MQDSLRNTLIILSAIVIAAIFIHGLWTIRKNKNPDQSDDQSTTGNEAEQSRKQGDIDPVKRDFGDLGFDQDGVGQARVIKAGAQYNLDPKLSLGDNQRTAETTSQMPAFSAMDGVVEHAADVTVNSGVRSPVQNHFATDSFSARELTSNDSDTRFAASAASEAMPEQQPNKQVYQAPVTQAKPKVKPAVQQYQVKTSDQTKPSGPTNTSHIPDQPLDSTITPLVAIEPQVIVISVVVGQSQLISGAALLPSLLTLGMKYGDMGIFHRHQDNAGNGKVTFSLANMMNPGSFDLDSMEVFATRGVSLFMTLPNAADGFDVFEQMLSAAKQLANEFQGQVLDDKRNPMTKQNEQHYTGMIREFERKNSVMNR